MNYTKLTLGELLSHANEIIKRNAISILKQLQKKRICKYCDGLLSENGTIQCYTEHDNYKYEKDIDISGQNCIYSHDHEENDGKDCVWHN